MEDQRWISDIPLYDFVTNACDILTAFPQTHFPQAQHKNISHSEKPRIIPRAISCHVSHPKTWRIFIFEREILRRCLLRENGQGKNVVWSTEQSFNPALVFAEKTPQGVRKFAGQSRVSAPHYLDISVYQRIFVGLCVSST